MKNNTYEEFITCSKTRNSPDPKTKALNDALATFHEKEVKKMGIPSFINFKCPFCKADLSYRSIRSIGVKYNARNMGDFFVEFMCWSCQVGDTMYYPKQIKSRQDLVELMQDLKKPDAEPILEESMYKAMYNNLMEKFVQQVQKEEKENGPA